MKFDPNKHHRHSVRLSGYDYTDDGAYFVTICTFNREHLFGEVDETIMRMNTQGEIVMDCWNALPTHFPYAECDSFVIMPNHVHGIVLINKKQEGAVSPRSPQAPKREFAKPIVGSLSTIIGSFKSAATRHINQLRETPGAALWQGRFYEHVIRDEDDWNAHRLYIQTNPARWTIDRENLPPDERMAME